MRWFALPLLLAVFLAAAACGEGDDGEEATATQSATAGPSPTVEPTAQAEEARRLLSLAPTADEFGAAFPDLAPFEQAPGGLGQEWEHVDFVKHGNVSGSGLFYRTSDETNIAYISLASFRDANGASGAMAEMIAMDFSQPDNAAFELGAGDEARGIASANYVVAILRQGRVVAFLLISEPSGEDRRDGMRQLALDFVRRSEDALAE